MTRITELPLLVSNQEHNFSALKDVDLGLGKYGNDLAVALWKVQQLTQDVLNRSQAMSGLVFPSSAIDARFEKKLSDYFEPDQEWQVVVTDPLPMHQWNGVPDAKVVNSVLRKDELRELDQYRQWTAAITELALNLIFRRRPSSTRSSDPEQDSHIWVPERQAALAMLGFAAIPLGADGIVPRTPYLPKTTMEISEQPGGTVVQIRHAIHEIRGFLAAFEETGDLALAYEQTLDDVVVGSDPLVNQKLAELLHLDHVPAEQRSGMAQMYREKLGDAGVVLQPWKQHLFDLLIAAGVAPVVSSNGVEYVEAATDTSLLPLEALAFAAGKASLTIQQIINPEIQGEFCDTSSSTPAPVQPQVTESGSPGETGEPTPAASPENQNRFEPEAIVTPLASEFVPAINPPAFTNEGRGGPIVGLSNEEIVKMQNQQWFRVYKQMNNVEGQEVLWNNVADFDAEMKKLAESRPELTISQSQSANGSAVITYIHNTATNSVLWGFTSEGAVAFAEPHLTIQETRLGEVPLPQGLTPEFRFNTQDKHWYLFGVNAQGQGVMVFIADGATRDNLQDKWQFAPGVAVAGSGGKVGMVEGQVFEMRDGAMQALGALPTAWQEGMSIRQDEVGLVLADNQGNTLFTFENKGWVERVDVDGLAQQFALYDPARTYEKRGNTIVDTYTGAVVAIKASGDVSEGGGREIVVQPTGSTWEVLDPYTQPELVFPNLIGKLEVPNENRFEGTFTYGQDTMNLYNQAFVSTWLRAIWTGEMLRHTINIDDLVVEYVTLPSLIKNKNGEVKLFEVVAGSESLPGAMFLYTGLADYYNKDGSFVKTEGLNRDLSSFAKIDERMKPGDAFREAFRIKVPGLQYIPESGCKSQFFKHYCEGTTNRMARFIFDQRSQDALDFYEWFVGKGSFVPNSQLFPAMERIRLEAKIKVIIEE
jgi:hypothetical protein